MSESVSEEDELLSESELVSEDVSDSDSEGGCRSAARVWAVAAACLAICSSLLVLVRFRAGLPASDGGVGAW